MASKQVEVISLSDEDDDDDPIIIEKANTLPHSFDKLGRTNTPTSSFDKLKNLMLSQNISKKEMVELVRCEVQRFKHLVKQRSRVNRDKNSALSTIPVRSSQSRDIVSCTSFLDDSDDCFITKCEQTTPRPRQHDSGSLSSASDEDLPPSKVFRQRRKVSKKPGCADSQRKKSQIPDTLSRTSDSTFSQPSVSLPDTDASVTLPDMDPVSQEDIVELSSDDGESSSVSSFGQENVHREVQCDSTGRIPVNVARGDGEELVYLAPQISRVAKGHQISGIRFLYDNLVESPFHFQCSEGFGCVLGNSMGLGKTLQVIAFLDVLFSSVEVRTVLIVVPVNVLQTWLSEFNRWLPPSGGISTKTGSAEDQTDHSFKCRNFQVYIVDETISADATKRLNLVIEWREKGGVLLIGYETMRSVLGATSRGCSDGYMCKEYYNALVNPGPEVIVCDEGQRIKNTETSLSQLLKAVRTRRRLVLTGFPIQNNLLEYWCMVDFVRPGYLGTQEDFISLFHRPIDRGQKELSNTRKKEVNTEVIQLMRDRIHVLQELLSGFVKTKASSDARDGLAPKREVVLMVSLSPVQRSLLKAFRESTARSVTSTLHYKEMKIYNHPDILYYAMRGLHIYLPSSDSTGARKRSSLTSQTTTPSKQGRSSLPLTSTPSQEVGPVDVSSNIEESSIHLSEESTSTSHDSTSTSEQPSTPAPKTRGSTACPLDFSRIHPSYQWASKAEYWTNYQVDSPKNGPKMALVLTLVRLSVALGDKIVVFSSSCLSLDMLQRFLGLSNRVTEPPTVNNNQTKATRWVQNKTYFRLDGNTPSHKRQKIITIFNDPKSEARLLIASTEAGCLGISLVGANRVVLMDASWNPCHDCQALCRVYRYGQTKPCFLYRLVADGTAERDIYEQNLRKQRLAESIADENFHLGETTSGEKVCRRTKVTQMRKDRVEMGLDEKELEELSSYGDDVMTAAVRQHSRWITQLPIPHDSLFMERHEDYRLSSKERKLAHERYEEAARGSAQSVTSCVTKKPLSSKKKIKESK